MKKDLIFAPVMLIIGVLLFLLRATGMTAHIAISVIGVAVLVAYAITTRKEWKFPVLEIVMRALYGVALISGIVIKVKYVAAVAIAHKIIAALFVVLLVVLFVIKLISLKAANNVDAASRSDVE